MLDKDKYGAHEVRFFVWVKKKLNEGKRYDAEEMVNAARFAPAVAKGASPARSSHELASCIVGLINVERMYIMLQLLSALSWHQRT